MSLVQLVNIDSSKPNVGSFYGMIPVGNKLCQRLLVRWVLLSGVLISCSLPVLAQRAARKHTRATPPVFKKDEFSGVFFEDPFAQLQGKITDRATVVSTESGKGANTSTIPESDLGTKSSSGDTFWKSYISGSSMEDLVKESKTRLDGLITTPAKFAGGGVVGARREFTLLACLMAVIARYPEEIRWQASALYGQRIFARVAMNCKVGTQPVFNEAKLRHQDLQSLLKGTKLSGNAEEVSWSDTADRGPTMQILEWALRENLAPKTSSDNQFRDHKDDIIKYAELVAIFGKILQQEGMNDADDAAYRDFAIAMSNAALEIVKAVHSNEAGLARTAVSRMDQACGKCHEQYR